MKYLYENQEIPKGLIPSIEKNPSLHPYFEKSFKGIRPKNVCGFLSVGDESHFIVPKIVPNQDEENFRIFIYMLLYAYDIQLKKRRDPNSPERKAPDLRTLYPFLR